MTEKKNPFSGVSLTDMLPWVAASVLAFFALDKQQAIDGVATAASVEAVNVQLVDLKADMGNLEAKLEKPYFVQENFDRQIAPFASRQASMFEEQTLRGVRNARIDARIVQIEQTLERVEQTLDAAK